jgi:hypothetical protein
MSMESSPKESQQMQPEHNEQVVGDEAIDRQLTENDQNPSTPTTPVMTQPIETEDIVLDEGIAPTPSTKPLAKRKRGPAKPRASIKTSDPNIEIEMRSHKPGPKKRRVIVYKEDLPQDEITIVEKSRKKGRPAKKSKLERVVEEPVEVTQHGPDVIQYHRPTPQTELTAKQLKHMELAQQFATLEQAAGRKLRQTTKGKVDKRCIVERSQKQMDSARRLVENNQRRRAEKEIANRAKTAGTVRDVISELTYASKSKAPEPEPEPVQVYIPPPPPPPPAPIRTRDLFSN